MSARGGGGVRGVLRGLLLQLFCCNISLLVMQADYAGALAHHSRLVADHTFNADNSLGNSG